MKKTLMTILGALYATAILSGCSIGMALSGHPEPDFDYITVGASREELEFELGKPISEQVLTDGKKESVYKYEMGNTVNAGRAAVWGYAWLTIIGILGEPIYDLIELSQGHDEETRVIYDAQNRAIEISGYIPPALSETEKAARAAQEEHVRKRPKPSTERQTGPSTPPQP
ncbi:MAG: hypothetical protein RI101_10575 [Nitrospira sp.]|jgi:hypothetical protein|nr:hypothetical protein [Nitrospira sp.]